MSRAISQMGKELQGLVAKENDSDSEHEEEEASHKDSPVEIAVPHNLATPITRNLANPIPLFGMLAPFVQIDISSVKDSVMSTMFRQPNPPQNMLAKCNAT